MGGSDPRAAQAGLGTICTVRIDAVARQALPHALPTNFETDSVARVELYIEDNPVNVILVEQALSTWPAVKVIAAENGRQGMELAHEHQPDVVLVDMGLPDMEGTDLARAC